MKILKLRSIYIPEFATFLLHVYKNYVLSYPYSWVVGAYDIHIIV